MKLCEKIHEPAAIGFWKATVFFLAAALPFLDLSAQSCPIKISNNLIEFKPAICVNTLGFLQGSMPAGGNGSYKYQWESSDRNCGENSFKPIKGATEKDYILPANADVNVCYRRTVVSGDCQDESNKVKLDPSLIQEPEPPTTLVVQPTCLLPTGTITVTSPAPAPGISYSIDGNNFTNTTGIFTGLSPKIYSVRVRYSAGCLSPVNNDTIKATPVIGGEIKPASATLCSGSVTLTVSGGTSYKWYRNGALITGATGATYTATEPGTYTADIVLGSCTAPASNKAVVVNSPPINFTVSGINPNCTIATGSITVENPSGGSGHGFVFSKDGGESFQAEPAFQNLPPGTYRIVVKDSEGCRSEAKTVTIKAFTTTLKATVSVSNISCSQSSGTAKVEASGGKAPYQYSIDGGAFQGDNSFKGLSAGQHKVVVEDAEGCRYEASFKIEQVRSTLAATATVTNAICDKKGAVVILATGGTAPYTYRIGTGNEQSGATFVNLVPGKYEITVSDQQGCSVTIPVEIKQSGSVPNLVVNNPPALCPGTTQNLKDPDIVKGSDKELEYTYWRNADATTALNNPGAVEAGTYYIKATNQKGCSAIKAVAVTMHNAKPGRITASGTPIICADQSVTLMATEGASYQWFRNDTAIAGARERQHITSLAGIYSVAINDGTCTVRAENTIRVQYGSCLPAPKTGVFVPSAFTPNRNGENDVLRPLLYNIRSLNYFRVFNRWGQVVFETNKIGSGWDGTIKGVLQPTETFTWILECTDNNGTIIRESGRSLLLR